MDLQIGTVFAGYTVLQRLGTGGMGAVYVVQHPRLPRQDAMKVIHSHLSSDAVFAARFQREAELAATLDHPSLVKVYDRGLADGRLWLTMQYVHGMDADQTLRTHGPLDPPRAVRVIGDIADALDHAHAAGLVHRDVKPANILLTRGATGRERAYLTDFGIAHASHATRQLTDTGDLLATLPYAAPEQLTGRPVSAAVDVYALGCVLYELVVGRRLFDQESPPALMAAVLNGPREEAWAALPPERPLLQHVVRRALAQEPEDRFPTCVALAEAAREAVPAAGPTVVVPRMPIPQQQVVTAPPTPVPMPAPTGGGGTGAPPSWPSAPGQQAPPPTWPPSPPWPSDPGPGQRVPTAPGGGGDAGTSVPGRPPDMLPPPGDWRPAGTPGAPRSRRGWLWAVAALVVVAAVVVAGVLVVRGLGLDAPGSVRAEAQTDGVQLRWQAVEGATEYEVLRDGEAVGRSAETNYLDAEAPSGAHVTYTVVALGSDGDRSGESDPRQVTSALHPAPDLAATVDGDGVRLTWGPVENAESYQVLRDGTLVRDGLRAAPFTEEGLSPGAHTYTVAALDEDGEAASSSAEVDVDISPWLGAAGVAAAFADLVPPAPGPGGWGDATCQIGALLDSSTADSAITCTLPSGIYVEYVQYPDQAAVDQRLATLTPLADPAGPQTTARGGWYRQSAPGVDPAWEAWGLTESGRELTEIYLQWEGHTLADLDTAWYYAAPW